MKFCGACIHFVFAFVTRQTKVFPHYTTHKAVKQQETWKNMYKWVKAGHSDSLMLWLLISERYIRYSNSHSSLLNRKRKYCFHAVFSLTWRTYYECPHSSFREMFLTAFVHVICQLIVGIDLTWLFLKTRSR